MRILISIECQIRSCNLPLTMTHASNLDFERKLVGRRTALLTMTSALLGTACGGGGSGSAGSPDTQVAVAGNITAPPTSPPTVTALPARLTLRGTSMVAPNGSAVMLRGINEGTWGEMQSFDGATIAKQGGNVVRVLIRWWGLYGSPDVESRADAAPGHFKPDHLAQFLKEVQWCIDAGLWVVPVIDSNCGQSGVQNQDMRRYCDPRGAYPSGHNFWTDLGQRQLFKEAWIYLAGVLKNYPQIAFYELLPEPLANSTAVDAALVSAFYQELMAGIEDGTGDTRTPFLVGARNAYDITLCDEAYIAVPRWANRVVYTGNLFIHPSGSPADTVAKFESRLAALSSMKSTRNVPVFVQQFGVRTGDDPTGFYLEAGLSRLNAAAIGYTGWQWRQNTSSMNEYAVVVRDAITGADIVKTQVLALYAKYWRDSGGA